MKKIQSIVLLLSIIFALFIWWENAPSEEDKRMVRIEHILQVLSTYQFPVNYISPITSNGTDLWLDSPAVKKWAVDTCIIGFLKKLDTLSMLSGYARTGNIPSLSNVVKYIDTASMLSKYLRKTDTANMLLGYQRIVPITLTTTSRTIGTVLSTTTAFQPSSQYDMDLSYTIDFTCISALTGQNGGAVTLYTSSTSTGTYTAFRSTLAQATGVLSTATQSQTLLAKIPKTTWCKLVFGIIGPNANTASFRDGQETPIQ